jgi:TM2 domain-containing membrane protein YozV
MYQVWIAYVLWLVGGFGALGLHRFYMKKIPTGVLWILTGGLAFLGSVYDFLTMTRQIEDANRRAGYLVDPVRSVEVTVKREKEPLERSILRFAAQNRGRVTAAQVAASSDWTIEQAQKHLDTLVRQNVCEMRVLKAGTVVYHFTEFDPGTDQEFEV